MHGSPSSRLRRFAALALLSVLAGIACPPSAQVLAGRAVNVENFANIRRVDEPLLPEGKTPLDIIKDCLGTGVQGQGQGGGSGAADPRVALQWFKALARDIVKVKGTFPGGQYGSSVQLTIAATEGCGMLRALEAAGVPRDTLEKIAGRLQGLVVAAVIAGVTGNLLPVLLELQAIAGLVIAAVHAA